MNIDGACNAGPVDKVNEERILPQGTTVGIVKYSLNTAFWLLHYVPSATADLLVCERARLYHQNLPTVEADSQNLVPTAQTGEQAES